MYSELTPGWGTLRDGDKAEIEALQAGETHAMDAPQTEQLNDHKLAPVALPEVDAMVQRELDVAARSSSAAADTDASGVGAGLRAPLNIAPKKVDWDLKRDVEKRLKKLQRRTQRAIVELIRKRVEQEAREDEGGGEATVADGTSSS